MSFTPVRVPDLESIIAQYYGASSLAKALIQKPSLIFSEDRKEEIEVLMQQVMNNQYRQFQQSDRFKMHNEIIIEVTNKVNKRDSSNNINSNGNQSISSSKAVENSHQNQRANFPSRQELFFRTIFPLMICLYFPERIDDLATDNQIDVRLDQDEIESKSNEDEEDSFTTSLDSEVSYETTIDSLKNISSEQLKGLLGRLQKNFTEKDIEPSINFLFSLITHNKVKISHLMEDAITKNHKNVVMLLLKRSGLTFSTVYMLRVAKENGNNELSKMIAKWCWSRPQQPINMKDRHFNFQESYTEMAWAFANKLMRETPCQIL